MGMLHAGICLIARKSPVSRLRARYTLPEEPRPSSSPSWYLESSTHCCGGFGRARRFLKLVWQCWPSEPS